jgi:hypothetical protein
MKSLTRIGTMLILSVSLWACTTYQVQPLPFKAPSAYPNATAVGGATVAAKAFVDGKEAQEAFGFDIRGAGMLPVQVVFDNQGPHPLEVNPAQTFLEDSHGNIWAVLEKKLAYDRAAKYAETKQIVTEGGYHAVLAGGAGALIGAAIGIVTGENVLSAAGKGAAVGAATGALGGGLKGYASGDARNAIVTDLRQKSMENKAVEPGTLAHGFIFFPGEPTSALQLRMQIKEKDTGQVHNVKFDL